MNYYIQNQTPSFEHGTNKFSPYNKSPHYMATKEPSFTPLVRSNDVSNSAKVYPEKGSDIKDFILNFITETVINKIASVWIKYILGLVFLVLTLFLAFIYVYQTVDVKLLNDMSRQGMLINNMVVNWMKSLPEVVVILLALFCAHMTTLLNPKLSLVLMGLLGAILMYVSLMAKCKRWILLGLGIFIIIYAILKSGYFDESFKQKTILFFFEFMSIGVVILILVDYMIYKPMKCSQYGYGAEDD